MKKTAKIAFIFALMITLAGCGTAKVDLGTIATVDGEKVPQALFEYSLMDVQESLKDEEKAPEDWEKGKIDGQNATEYAKEKAQEKVKEIYAIRAWAKKNGVTITSEDNKKIDEEIAALKKDIGGQAKFEEALAEAGINEAVWKEVRLNAMYEENAKKKYVDGLTEKQKKDYYLNEMKLAKHVLIKTKEEDGTKYSESKIAENKAKALLVLKKAKSGADFDKLIQEYSEDPGSKSIKEGYLVGRFSNMVKPFLDSTFSLKYGEVSPELVESEYGFHIIKVYKTLEDKFKENAYAKTGYSDVDNNMWGSEKERIVKEAKINLEQKKYDEVTIKK